MRKFKKRRSLVETMNPQFSHDISLREEQLKQRFFGQISTQFDDIGGMSPDVFQKVLENDIAFEKCKFRNMSIKDPIIAPIT